MAQPIIRGIHAVGAVDIIYKFNGPGNILKVPKGVIEIPKSATENVSQIYTGDGLKVAGFRLDSEFLRANPQIASSFVIPLLGGGGAAITNNNRTGSLVLNCTHVSSPNTGSDKNAIKMYSGSGFGVKDWEGGNVDAYDLVLIAQIQQAQVGGDSAGATLSIQFTFNNIVTTLNFEGCTVASVDPIGLSGNDAVNYNVTFNYLNWAVKYGLPTTAEDAKEEPWFFTETAEDGTQTTKRSDKTTD